MQIEINGQRNITLDFDAPKKFKLFKDGAEVPYIRTGKNSFRLGRGVDGVVELEEVIEKPKIVKPMQLQPQQMALVNPNDVIMINQAAQQLEIEQGILSETQKQISYTQEYLDIQQQNINEAVAGVKSLETDNAQRISNAESGIFNLAGEIANVENNANDGIVLTRAEIENHENADNPHGITKKTIGLYKVDNTSDLDKPISKAVQSALDEKADKTDIDAIREEIGEYQEKNEKISNALSSYTGGLASMADHRELEGRDYPDQHPIGAITGLETALDGKVEKTDTVSQVYGTDSEGNQTTYDLSALGSVNDVQVDGISIVEDHIANLGTMALESLNDYSTTAVADTLYAAKSYEETIDNHIDDKNNPHEVTKDQVGLGNVDNTSDLNKPISTATQTALDGKQASLTQTQLDAVNSGANTTNIGQITTNANDISALQSGKADKATTLAGYGITDAYTKTTADSTFVPQTRTVNGKALSSNISLTYSDVGADASGSASTAETNAKNYADSLASNYATAAQGAKADTAVQPGDLATVATSGDYDDLLNKPTIPVVNNATLTIQKNGTNVQTFTANASTNVTANITVPTKVSDLTNDSNFQTATQVANSIATETTNRENADISLQNQIDAIVSSSDVFDIVGTYAELQAYDISTVPVNDIIKVLVDSTHSNAATYYRCVESGGVKSWSYIGSEGAYYTKGEADSTFVPQTRTVNNKALSSNISLTASDVGALPDSTVIPTVNDATVTIQKNGGTVSTFTLNQSSNETVNITVPTKVSDLTNDSGFISGITSSDVTTALGYTPYNSSNPSGYQANVIETVKVNGTALTPTNKAVDVTVPTKTSDLNNDDGFITGITSSDVTTALGYTPYDSSNPSGYTDNVGTVTSVNNTSPDSNGNVTLSIPTVNNPTITITQGGVTKGSFTLNQASGDTIALDAGGGSSYTAGTGIDITNNVISVDGVSTSEVTLATVATTGAYSDLTGIPTVDQTYDGTSTNAQSGTAVAEAISDLLADDNTWTGANHFDGQVIFRTNLTPSTATTKSTAIEDNLIGASVNTDGKIDGMSVSRVQTTDGSRFVYYRCGFRNSADTENLWGTIAVGVDINDDRMVNLRLGNDYVYVPATDKNNTAVNTVNKSKSQNGYFKLGNGLIVQWGRISISSYNQTGEVTFPTAFTSANYGIGNTGFRSSNGQGYISLTSQSSTKFEYRMVASSTNYNLVIFWVAIGY